MKKKNGFTLIELLAVFGIMSLILIIAIINISGISKAKKEEAWKAVVSQIETAAVDYISSNQYLYTGLSGNLSLSGDLRGELHLGILVKEDYVNSVTDPRTGKAISKCSVININKTNSSVTAKFDENSINITDDCDDSRIIISEVDSINVDLKEKCYDVEHKNIGKGANGWCYEKRFAVKTKDGSIPRSTEYITKYKPYGQTETKEITSTFNIVNSFDGLEYSDYTDACNYGTSNTNTITQLYVTDDNDNTNVITLKNYGIDKKPPEFKVTISADTDIAANEVTYHLKDIKEDQSGVKNAVINNESMEIFSSALTDNSLVHNTILDNYNVSTLPADIYDKVGNKGTESGNYNVPKYEACKPENTDTYENIDICPEGYIPTDDGKCRKDKPSDDSVEECPSGYVQMNGACHKSVDLVADCPSGWKECGRDSCVCIKIEADSSKLNCSHSGYRVSGGICVPTKDSYNGCGGDYPTECEKDGCKCKKSVTNWDTTSYISCPSGYTECTGKSHKGYCKRNGTSDCNVKVGNYCPTGWIERVTKTGCKKANGTKWETVNYYTGCASGWTNCEGNSCTCKKTSAGKYTDEFTCDNGYKKWNNSCHKITTSGDMKCPKGSVECTGNSCACKSETDIKDVKKCKSGFVRTKDSDGYYKCFKVTNDCDSDCGEGACKKRTITVDENTDEICNEGDVETIPRSACTSDTPAKTKKVQKWTRTIFKWHGSIEKKCSVGTKVTVRGNGESSDHKYTGPYVAMPFEEYDCSCRKDENGKITVTGKTKINSHPYDNHYSYIIYQNNNDGVSACNNVGLYYVQGICTTPLQDLKDIDRVGKHGIIIGSGGWKTSSGSGVLKQAWYNNKYDDTDTAPVGNTASKVCKWACEKGK